ncbi:hypothetical protein XENORESO_018896 [Xenotaenia resolanae]|uniref:NADH dehydrogenase subunit 4 n=1 Tax=Xenotaenia resolanae TaxID=208358 RepID=A0ABV0WKH0_9TELE
MRSTELSPYLVSLAPTVFGPCSKLCIGAYLRGPRNTIIFLTGGSHSLPLSLSSALIKVHHCVNFFLFFHIIPLIFFYTASCKHAFIKWFTGLMCLKVGS